ncbi:ROK family transcriptional regulator [Longispora albida]|uniref:ROK family transcriptional regulator n=1 Tax=Longispora albida TaxID=203523 RepID=UPI001B7FA127|nr:ROK family transcriptional regulator [Longispora albida]
MILRLLRDEGPLPRQELARRSGLSAPSVSAVITELTGQGLVAETGTRSRRSKVGPPGTDLALDAGASAVLAVDSASDRVRVASYDILGQLIEAVDCLPADVPARLRRMCQDVEATGRTVLGIGVATPDPIDHPERAGHRLAERISRALQAPVVEEFGAQAMALAEARFGDGRHARSVLFVSVQESTGVGIVIPDDLFQAGRYGIPRFGHQQVVADRRPCHCGGHGCLETVVSTEYLARLGIQLGDSSARADEFLGRLCDGLAPAVSLFNPTLVVLGGALTELADPLLDRLRRGLLGRISPALRENLEITPTSFGENAGVLGAAAVALDSLVYCAEPVQ